MPLIPTPTYALSWPTPGASSWYQQFVACVNSLEVAVASRFTETQHATLVVSWTPATSVTLTYNESGFLNCTAADSRWTTVSAAPYGACVGSFGIIGTSGHAALITVQAPFSCASQLGGTGLFRCFAWYRAIVMPGSLLVAPSNWWQANWGAGRGNELFPVTMGREHVFHGLLPLAAGTYKLTLEVRPFSVNSQFYYQAGLPIIITMREVTL